MKTKAVKVEVQEVQEEVKEVKQKQVSKRTHALLELLNSERAYASDLALIRDVHIPLALGESSSFSFCSPVLLHLFSRFSFVICLRFEVWVCHVQGRGRSCVVSRNGHAPSSVSVRRMIGLAEVNSGHVSYPMLDCPLVILAIFHVPVRMCASSLLASFNVTSPGNAGLGAPQPCSTAHLCSPLSTPRSPLSLSRLSICAGRFSYSWIRPSPESVDLIFACPGNAGQRAPRHGHFGLCHMHVCFSLLRGSLISPHT